MAEYSKVSVPVDICILKAAVKEMSFCRFN